MQVQSCGFAHLNLLLFLRSRCRRHCSCLSSLLLIRPRVKGSNIVDQQLPTLLNVICCVRLHTLLHVVACCWEFIVASVCTLLQHGRNNTQHRWRNNVGSCCIRLHTTATRTQQHATLLAQQCRELLHPFAHHCNTDATTRNIVGATILGIVVSFCT